MLLGADQRRYSEGSSEYQPHKNNGRVGEKKSRICGRKLRADWDAKGGLWSEMGTDSAGISRRCLGWDPDLSLMNRVSTIMRYTRVSENDKIHLIA